VGVTVQAADQGDATTIAETVTATAEDLEVVATVTERKTAVVEKVVKQGAPQQPSAVDLATLGRRTYIAEPNRGRRAWKKKAARARRVVCESSADPRCARPRVAATAERTTGTAQCASL
jgi:hypothetical protein